MSAQVCSDPMHAIQWPRIFFTRTRTRFWPSRRSKRVPTIQNDSHNDGCKKSIREAEEAGDRTRVSQLRDEVSALRRNADGAAGMLRAPRNGEARKIDRQTDSRWKGFPSELVRASEIQSPAPPQHFLRQFGQSDRETIENANREANVPQILTLLNGPVYSQLTKPNSLFYRNLAAAPTPLAKLQVVFLSILSRNPTVSEANALVPELESRGRDALADISWALINTREFAFIQ